MYAMLKAPFDRFKEKIKFIDKQKYYPLFGKGKHILPYEADYKYLGIGTLTGVKNFSIKKCEI